MKKQKILSILTTACIILLDFVWLFSPATVLAARSIVFPVAGPASFSNDYNSPRSGGIHAATDIFAPKMRPLLSAIDGVVSYVAYPQPSWGYMIGLRDNEGYTYNYLHINNDTLGTDDGSGNPMNAYAADMKVGNQVFKGQLIGWVGDSGNAEDTSSHLHFEIINPDGGRDNPYDSLIHAEHRSAPIAYYPQLPNELLPYGPVYGGGINISRGEFGGNQESETVVGAGRGGGPHVRIFDSNNVPIDGGGFYAYHPQFYGGVDVAAGDVDGDGIDEIITAAGPGGGPHVRILKTNGTEVGGFYAYDPSFTGGVRVAAGDVDGDGIDEIITGTIHGAPHVRVLRVNGTEVGGFYAYAPDFTGGVDVASADVTGSLSAEVIVAAGPGGGPHVRVLESNGTELRSFYAYAPSFTGGVRVSADNVRTSSAKSEILTVPMSGGGPHQRMFSGSAALVSETMFLEQWWSGFYDIAAGYNESQAAAGANRRATIRQGLD